MTAIVWNEEGKHFFEAGVERGVLYPCDDKGKYQTGVAWDGLISVSEKPSGAEPTPVFASGVKYLNLMSKEEFAAAIEAYYSPEEFDACDGIGTPVEGLGIRGQKRNQFGLAYRTRIGNDVQDVDYGYNLHIIYGCKASPSEKQYQTLGDSTEAMTLSWEISTVAPKAIEGFKPTASFVIDSTKVKPKALKAIEDKLYGTESNEPTLPSPEELVKLVKDNQLG